jgi:hypothetical protein
MKKKAFMAGWHNCLHMAIETCPSISNLPHYFIKICSKKGLPFAIISFMIFPAAKACFKVLDSSFVINFF